ncbi:MAG: cysteine desulfurase NifS [Candidatus Aminicenantes bacterium RBG_13_59_9]|nr:MAG: cysteine desulfurase NifS [Candidatus Aminicenantes bacterium RBG_13_59_9]
MERRMRRIYLDHIASTPVHPLVLEEMLPYLKERFGNPQSLHADGQEAMAALEEAREKVAGLLGAESAEVYFTASGSESNNLAVKGLALAQREKGNHLVLSAVEHQSVLHAAKSLEKLGFTATLVPVDKQGRVDPEEVRRALRKETVLVSVMLANGEVGTIEPVAEIAEICRSRKILFHSDAVDAVGNIPVNVKTLGVDALSLAAHQFYGPKGAAALFLKKATRILPLIDGGIQEGGRRAGTENVAAIVGLGKAAELAAAEMAARGLLQSGLRDKLMVELPRRVDRVVLTGHPVERLPHHASFCVEFIEGEGMLLGLDMKGIACSSGSACTSKALKASHVLLAMGLDHALAQGSVVFSLVDGTTSDDIGHLLEVFPPVIDRLRKMSPLYTKYLEEKGQ